MDAFVIKSKMYAIGKLIDSIYQILCLFEECDDNLPLGYLNRVISECISANDLYFEGELSYIIIQLNSLKQIENQTHKKVKKITFDCANSLCRLRDVILNG